MLVAGPSQSGKSHFLLNLVKFREQLFTANFSRVIYCQKNIHTEKNKAFFAHLQELFPQAELVQGLPVLSELHLNINAIHTLLLVDDMMRDVVGCIGMNNLATNDVHNFNITVIFVFQNYFARGKYGNDLVRNCQYKVVFYNRTEMLELRTISTHTVDTPRFLSYNFNYLQRHYPEDRHHYILIDSHSKSPMSQMWCRARIFPDDQGEIKPIIFFVNPNCKK